MSVRYRTRSLPCKLFKSFLKKTKQNKTCTSLSNGSICIGNQIILVQFGINKQEEIFLKTNNLWSLKKLTSACLFPNFTRKIMWLRVNNIHGKITRWLIIIKHKQSARIKCKNNLFKPCVRSKQLRTIKTIICSYIFTSLRRKKFKVRLNSSRNWITFDEMESSFPRFNHVFFNLGVRSLE